MNDNELLQRSIVYQPRGRSVSVVFAGAAQVVHTLEGDVECRVGDAIVTGAAGESWPVPRKEFDEKYELEEATSAAAPGLYKKKQGQLVNAIQLTEPLDIQLSDARGSLHGEIGDWCVWQVPGKRRIVRNDIFRNTYDLGSIPVYISYDEKFANNEIAKIHEVVAELQTLLPNTRLVVISDSDPAQSSYPVWFRIAGGSFRTPHVISLVPELPLDSFCTLGKHGLLANLKRTPDDRWFTFTGRKLKSLFSWKSTQLRRIGEANREPSEEHQHEVAETTAIIVEQLVAMECFNEKLASGAVKPVLGHYIIRCEAPLEPSYLARIHYIGAIADNLASENQEEWQELVLATTSKLAKVAQGQRGLFKLLFQPTLISLGLFAALALASFSELSGGCDPSDFFAVVGCASDTWKHWAGPFLFVAYLIALTWAWIMYANAKAKRREARHQDFRLLAECLRVDYLRGVLQEPCRTADDLPVMQSSESSWVRLALRSIHYAQGQSTPANRDLKPSIDWATKYFIEDQISYHIEKIFERRELVIGLLSGIAKKGLLLFVASVCLLGVNVVIEVFVHEGILSPMGHHLTMITLVAGLAWWGGLRKIIDIYGLEQEIQRGEVVYTALKEAKDDSVSIMSAARIFAQDQAAWHALHRSKPVEAVTGA